MVRIMRQFGLAAVMIAAFMALTLFSSASAYAASFTASVDQSSIAVGESLTLDLKLSGAAPQGRPDFEALREDFTVYSQGQSSQTTIINNKMSSTINWQLVLIPTRSGQVTIPEISLKTDAGILQSQAITVNVTKTATKKDAASRVVFVQTELSKSDPYQNEPVIFTVKLVARRSIANIQLDELSVDGAIVEAQGEPRIYDGTMQGARVKVIEMKYLITPLDIGGIKIPPYAFQGQVETGQRTGVPGDAFGMMGGLFSGFSGFKAFAVASEEALLNVKPPATKMDPWLPLTGLKIDDHVEGLDKASVGQPLTRTITMAATGAVGAALPELSGQAAPEKDFKVYADKPVTGDNVGDDGVVTGWREERYTLIPQHEGKLTLPEIKVPWWNVQTNQIEYATAPEWTINVKPGEGVSGKTARTYPDSATAQKQEPDAKAPEKDLGVSLPENAGVSAGVNGEDTGNRLLYIVIGLLASGVCALTGAVIYLFRQLAAERGQGLQKVARDSEHSKSRMLAGDLKAVDAEEALRGFIQDYAHKHWGLPRHAGLPTIVAALETSPNVTLDEETKDMLLALDAALYGGGSVDLERAKSQFAALIKKTAGKALAGTRSPHELQLLNPS